MTPPNWTDEQLRAILERGNNLLVAASAGTGKTAVLVERIVRAVTGRQPAPDIDRFLVVTFTEAAAGEMRQRLSAALAAAVKERPGEDRLKRQLFLLPRAHIGTLHSFCSDLVRRYFYLLDLDPGFRVMEENEAEMLRRDVLDNVLNAMYEERSESSPREPFLYLARALSGRRGDDGALTALILSLYDYAYTLPRPRAWLKNLAEELAAAAETPWEEQPWLAAWRAYVERELLLAREKLLTAKKLAARPGGPGRYGDVLAQDLALVEKMLALTKKPYAELQAALADPPWPRLPRLAGGEAAEKAKKQVQALRDGARNALKNLSQNWFSRPAEGWLEDFKRAAPLVEALVTAVLRFDTAYREVRRERAVADFADLEHYALAVLAADGELSPWGEKPPADPEAPLKPSPVAEEYRRRLAEVLVDEYQDTSGIQEAILQLVSPPGSRFAVGDAKQSIYRFRRADPQVFLRRYRKASDLPPEKAPGTAAKTGPFTAGEAAGSAAALSDGSRPAATAAAPAGTGFRLDLNVNFRSRPAVLATVNELFRRLMTTEVGEMDYDRRAALRPGFSYPAAPSGKTAGPVEFHILESGTNGKDSPEAAAEDSGEPAGEQPAAGEAAGEGEELTAEEIDAVTLEARWVAGRIWRLVREEDRVVYDRESKNYRPITWRDVVLLLRSPRRRAAIFLQELRRHGIPAYADGSGGYFAAPEVQVVLSLLRLLDNARQDIPLAAVLRSPLVGLNAAQLAAIRLACPEKDFFAAVEEIATGEKTGGTLVSSELREKLQAFWRQLEAWRELARTVPPAELIEEIYRQTGYFDLVGALPDGLLRQANLLALVDRSRQFAGTVYRGLFRFLRYIERLQEEGGDLDTARSLAENENVVRVMSIHRSKGLEFPAVVVAGLGWPFNFRDLQAGFLCHRHLGCGPKIYDLERGVVYPTLKHQLLKEQLRLEALAEEMRLLYVALTRAREQLIVTAATRDLAAALENWRSAVPGAGEEGPLSPACRAQARTFLDWVGPALLAQPAASGLAPEEGVFSACAGDWQLTLWPAESLSPLRSAADGTPAPDGSRLAGLLQNLAPYPEDELAAAEAEWAAAGATVAGAGELENRLFWSDPRLQLSSLPSKVTVTGWLHHQTEAAEEAELLLPGPGRPAVPTPGLPASFAGSAASPETPLPPGFTLPRFLAGRQQDPAARGRAVHLLMQKLDLKAEISREEVQRQLAELAAKKIILPEEAGLVPVEEVARFFTTSLGQKVLRAARAGRLWRELPFTLGLPVAELYPELAGRMPAEATAGETILLQGVIDCLLLEEEGLVIIDFKTDRLAGEDPDTAAGRYKAQLSLYARAAEKIIRRPVQKRYLYFFAPGKEVEV